MSSITTRFLSLHPGVLFLFTIMVGFNWYGDDHPSREIITSIVNTIGTVGLLIWFYAICEKSVAVLRKKKKELKIMKTYKIAPAAVLISFIALMMVGFVDPLDVATESDLQRGEAFTYKRIVFGILTVTAIGVLLMYRNTLKLLSSAETGKEQSFSDYYKSFLLLFFLPWIAVWFIQPRVKKI